MPLFDLGDGIRVRRRTSRRACSSTARTTRAIARCPTATSSSRATGRTTMVDVGYNHKAYGEVLANELRRRELAAAARGAGRVRRRARRTCRACFITHAHFDHMGNIEEFPNATFYIQERELSKWVWSMSLERRFRWLMLGIDPADIMKAVDLARQGRLVCVDGDRENVLPGIDLHAAFDTHTWGSMYVHGPQRPGGAARRTPGCFPAISSTAHENLRGTDPNDPQYIPVGLATGSQFNLIMTAEEMIKAGGRRSAPRHSGPRRAAQGSVSVENHQGRACESPSSRSPTARTAA